MPTLRDWVSEQANVRVRVKCAGVVIGVAEFDPADGLAHAHLTPNIGYEIAAAAAQELGQEFTHTQFWSPILGDFADEAAGRWRGERLALEDEMGRELGVNNIAVLERPIEASTPDLRIVADFRPDLARIEALLRTVGPGGGGQTRPAA